MSSITEINSALGAARNDVFDKMAELLKDTTKSAGDKSAALLNAQAELGITDGVQNIISKAYNRWQQTGQ